MPTLSPKAPAAFIFDCDGTLLQSMGMWLSVQPELLASYGVQTTADDFAEFEALPMIGECEEYHRKWGVGADAHEVYDRLMAMLLAHYRSDVPLRRGVRAFLDEASASGIPMAIATSTPVVAVETGLQATGIRDFFEVIVTTEDAGASKDHPDVYDLALRRLCAGRGMDVPARSEVWVFEDAPFGLKSSGSVGYRRVGIFDPEGRGTRPVVQANCEIFIDEFSELTFDRILSFEERS